MVYKKTPAFPFPPNTRGSSQTGGKETGMYVPGTRYEYRTVPGT